MSKSLLSLLSDREVKFIEYARRYEDMSRMGHLTVMRQPDGDVVLSIASDDELRGFRMASLEFTTPFSGGGQSEHTFWALLALSEAMALDEEKRPQDRSSFRKQGQFEVYATQGQGSALVAEQSTLEQVLDWVERHQDDASFGIKQPDGTWYKWPVKPSTKREALEANAEVLYSLVKRVLVSNNGSLPAALTADAEAIVQLVESLPL